MNKEHKLKGVADIYGFNCHWLYVVIFDLFGIDDFSDMRILDIGAGQGLHACALAALGAKEVVALEPESKGSRPGVSNIFEDNIRKLNLENIIFLNKPLEEFNGEPESFNHILMYSSINHINENYVRTLDYDTYSQNYFIKILTTIRNWLNPGGQLIIHDAARSHVFSPLLKAGILKRNPRYPTIEWQKHQDPEIWKNVLKKVGFRQINYHWAVYTRYDWIRAVFGWSSTISWIINPHFVIRANR